jgi:tRNA threonylcarbamoyladenosine biosynthesis protein TsaE
VATFISNNPAETEAIGRLFAKDVGLGSVLALQGALGTGKTQFVKGFVAGVGSSASVTSPTFTIVHEYPGGRLPIYHFDFFRLRDPIIFSATASRWSNGRTVFPNSFPSKRAGLISR